jgi:hypothetical protein
MDFAPARQRQGVVDKQDIKAHADDAEDNRAIKHTSEDSVIATTALPADWSCVKDDNSTKTLWRLGRRIGGDLRGA